MSNINDIYQRITDKIIEQLEIGVRPWLQEWQPSTSHVPATPQRSTGDPYRGINTIMLWLARRTNGYAGNKWLTFRQALALGGAVRKGETGHVVVKYGTFEPKGPQLTTADETKLVPFLKGYTVFNVDQIDGLPTGFYPQPTAAATATIVRPIESVERFVSSSGVNVTYAGDRACYRPEIDDILMPDRGRFTNETFLYSTLLHELAHWTAAPSRLNRELKGRFGASAYAAEELVAELTAAFLCADLNVPHDPQGNTATYVANWLAVLRNDRRAIFTAAAKAQQAADYLHKLQPSDSL